MSIKGMGMVFIIAGCSSVGFSIASASRWELRLLQSLIRAITCMENQLQYNLSPLPELCRQAGKDVSGPIREVLLNLSRELDWQIAPDAYSCMHEALSKSRRLPARVHTHLLQLGRSLGRFDLSGQLRELEGIRESCREDIMKLTNNQENRLRSYQTLGICAGTALAILLV